VTRFTYHGDTKGTVALGTSFPSKIIHLRLEDFIGNSVICQKGAFLCGSDTINIEMVSSVFVYRWWWAPPKTYTPRLTFIVRQLLGVRQEAWGRVFRW
jgi:hypothetical protein